MKKQFPDGFYTGWSFDNIHRDGLGQMAYNDNSVFYGVWKKNKRNGPGTLKRTDGTILKGTWVNDKLQGEATLYFKDGRIQVVEFKNDKSIKVISESSKQIQSSKIIAHKTSQHSLLTKKSTQIAPQQTKTQSKRLIEKKTAQITEVNREIIRRNSEAEKHFKSGVSLFKKGEYTLAIEEFKEASRITPSYEVNDVCKQNIEACKKAIEIEIENDRIQSLNYHINQGQYYYNLGDEYHARIHFEEAIKLCTAEEYELRKKLEEYRYECM